MEKLKKDGTPDMRGRHGNHAKASKAGSWQAGSRIRPDGYVQMRVGRNHPLAQSGEWALEHLVIWVSAGHKRPEPGYVLHHKNGEKTDNRIANLEVMKSSIHMAKHMKSGNSQSKLRFDQVSSIRELYDSGEMNTRELSGLFGVEMLIIQRVVSRKTYINGPNGRD